MKIRIIAEAGVNHNGELDIAYKLCDAAKWAGADVIKFQTWITEDIITKEIKKADYQIQNTGNEESQYDMLKKLELSFDDFREIKKYCDEIGIEFASTADDKKSIDFIYDELKVKFAKIGSGDLTNIQCLKEIGKKKVPVILATGMSYLSDVEYAYNTLIQNGAPKVTLLHCTTNYPCPPEEVNLNAMLTLKEAFKCECGYSDHTEGIEVAIAAAALGASVIEKHFTLDKNMDGPDHKASIEPHELKQLINGVRKIEIALGNGIKAPTGSEIKIADVVKKKIVARKSIKKGEIIMEENIIIKRSEKGIAGNMWDSVVGSKAWKDFEINEPIDLL